MIIPIFAGRTLWCINLKLKVTISFFAYARTQFSLLVKNVQAENGTEFVNKIISSFLTAQGSHFRLSCPYTSQNGKAERVLRTLNNVTRTLLVHSHMAASYWAEALATYLLNRRPCSAIQNDVPYRLLLGKPWLPLVPQPGCHDTPQTRTSLHCLCVSGVSLLS
jgi:hypothetical protein